MTDSTEQTQRIHAIIKGRVQGVSFRYNTMQEARRLMLTGWVRNRHDGSVEVVAEGDKADLDRLTAFLQKGPPAARVNDVDLKWSAPTGEFDSFDIRHFV